jgi:hypothetical protein
VELIERRFIRGQKVMLDSELAVHQVTTGNLNLAVR